MTCNGMAFFPTNFMLQASHDEDDHHTPDSLSPLFQPCTTTTQDFHGGAASFLGKRYVTTELCDQQDTNINIGEEELSDDGLVGSEKKRRLNIEQVKTLERNFELGNKLDPERKMQLATALGLQPRQIAIWFQNRRARWKTKQLEKDYDVLKKQFEAIKAQNQSLVSQNHKLHVELMALKKKQQEPTADSSMINLNIKETTEGSYCSNDDRSENSSERIKLDISTNSPRRPLSPSSNYDHQHHHKQQQQQPIIPNLFPSGASAINDHHHRSSSAHHHPIFHNNLSSRVVIADHHHLHGLKTADQSSAAAANNIIKEEGSFCNMFGSIEDPSGLTFWPWLEQQQQFN